jgi:hypothetical protein
MAFTRPRGSRTQREMCARSHVVRGVVREHPLEPCRAQHNDVIEALTSNRADEALDVGVGVSSQLHRLRAVRHKPSGLPIPFIPCGAGRFP